MIHAKNYETAYKSVKVMPRNTVASFFPDTVQIAHHITVYEIRQ